MEFPVGTERERSLLENLKIQVRRKSKRKWGPGSRPLIRLTCILVYCADNSICLACNGCTYIQYVMGVCVCYSQFLLICHNYLSRVWWINEFGRLTWVFILVLGNCGWVTGLVDEDVVD